MRELRAVLGRQNAADVQSAAPPSNPHLTRVRPLSVPEMCPNSAFQYQPNQFHPSPKGENAMELQERRHRGEGAVYARPHTRSLWIKYFKAGTERVNEFETGGVRV